MNVSRRSSLSRSRALMLDVLHEHRKIPTCAHDRLIDLSHLRSLRAAAPFRISWVVLFLKAYGIVSARHPLLRQFYVPWPWPHVYEHPHSVGVLALHREFRGEPWLFFPNFDAPEAHSLVCLQRMVDVYKFADVRRVHRRQLNMSGFPLPLRRLIWWLRTNAQPERRAKRMGTFCITTLAGQNTEIQSPPSIQSTSLTYGPLDQQGQARVTLTYDHRLMDGMFIAQVLDELVETLHGEIADELSNMYDAALHRCCAVRRAA